MINKYSYEIVVSTFTYSLKFYAENSICSISGTPFSRSRDLSDIINVNIRINLITK